MLRPELAVADRHGDHERQEYRDDHEDDQLYERAADTHWTATSDPRNAGPSSRSARSGLPAAAGDCSCWSNWLISCFSCGLPTEPTVPGTCGALRPEPVGVPGGQLGPFLPG